MQLLGINLYEETPKAVRKALEPDRGSGEGICDGSLLQEEQIPARQDKRGKAQCKNDRVYHRDEDGADKAADK